MFCFALRDLISYYDSTKTFELRNQREEGGGGGGERREGDERER